MCYRRKQLIFMLGLSIGAGLCMGVLSIAFCGVSVKSALQNGMAAQQVSFKIAENEGIVSKEKKEQARPFEQKKLTPATDKPKTVSRAKTTPPKKFVPSEKIRADQAVDFPADI
jgi:hypothetical protein